MLHNTTGNKQREKHQANCDSTVPDSWIATFCFWYVGWMSIFVSSVNEKVPLFSSWHHFCLPAQVDWDLIQDVVDCLMLLLCFQSLTVLKICTDACSPPWGARLQLFLFQILSLSSLPVSVCLWEVMLKFGWQNHLWNYLKCLYNVLLNFGYRSNTTTADSFICKNSTTAVLEASSWHITVYTFQLCMQLVNHKWWAPLAELLPALLIKV